MSDYLRHNEFVPFAPDETGVEVNVHHCKLGVGNDKLYIRRTDDGHAIIAHCFHCSKRGYYPVPTVAAYKAKKSHGSSLTHSLRDFSKPSLPSDLTTNTSEWPAEARVWINRGRISRQQVVDNGIGWSESFGRIVIPVYYDGELSGFQTRKILKNDKLPKYLTKRDRTKKFWFNKELGSDTCVIVEDVLSAIRVGEVTDSVALLGVGVSDSLLLYLNSKYKTIVIWLDNDNSIVKENRLKIYNRLSLYLDNVKIVYEEIDPKNLTTPEIQEIIDNV